MKTNAKREEATIKTHGGAPAAKESAEKELVRTVSCCLLWENAFYESGCSIAARIKELCADVSVKFACDLAVRAREELKLRHVPLYLCVQLLAKKGTPEERNMVGETIGRVIQRPDELAEIFALYWKDGKKAVPRQLKAGVAKAFRKFSEFQLAKWNRDNAVKLRDALFISHPKPKDDAQAKAWKKLVDGTLETPDTWEVALSAGKDKKATFERLIADGKLGYMALLQNLRNMEQAGCDRSVVEKALVDGAEGSWALPFRFITAARHAISFEPALDKAMCRVASALPKLAGRTLLVVDVSGSMGGMVAGKGEISRIDAACALGILMREQAADITAYATAGNDGTYTHATEIVPARHGFALRDAINAKAASLGGGGIFLKKCMDFIASREKDPFDRVVVITDEQDCDSEKTSASQAKKLGKFNYIVNIGVYEPALPVTGAGWIRVSGFSERVVDWMMAEEQDASLTRGAQNQ